MSEVFADAAGEYLAARGRSVPSKGATRPGATGATGLDAIAKAIERQGEVMAAMVLRMEGLDAAKAPLARAEGSKPARAMRAVIDALHDEGPDGLTPTGLAAAMMSAGIRSGTAEIAKAQLREAGVIRFETRRWYIAVGT